VLKVKKTRIINKGLNNLAGLPETAFKLRSRAKIAESVSVGYCNPNKILLMYKSILLLITGCCFITTLQSQTNSPNVVNSTGGTMLLNNGDYLEFSVGETAVTSLNIGGNEVGFTQGLLQPTLGYPYIINTHEAFDDKYSFKCFPNPVSDFLSIETDYKNFTNFQIINLQGQIIQERIFNYSPIDCTLISSGGYFIRLYSKSNPESKTFKLFKQ
jgi:hypothetical protein